MLTVALVTLGNPGTMTGGYLYHLRLAELAPNHDARLQFVSFPELPFPLPALYARRVLERARSQRAAVLVLDSIAAAFLAPVLVGPPSPPLVGMLHQPPGGIDHARPRAALQGALDRFAYRQARRLLVASEDLATQLQSHGIAPARLRVVPPGRDVSETVGPLPDDLRQGRKAAFLAVGNWVERKGLHSLLEAFSRLPDQAGTLHLVGDDRAQPAYAAALRARLARPDLANRVVVHGPVSRDAVAAFYSAADVFVLPSLREPYGTVYGEAMTFGLPVVGWRAGNLPHLAAHEAEGLLLEPGDVEGLAAALACLADDDVLRIRLGAAARERAHSRPTWNDTAGLFFGSIREVL